MPTFDSSEDDGYWNLFYLGTFGYDMLSLFTDCVTATTANCDYDSLVANYDGWAIGTYMYVSYEDTFDYLTEGFCLPDFTCVGFYLEYTSGYGITDNTYTFKPLSWQIDSATYTLGSSVPAMSASHSTYQATAADAYYGMNETLFYTAADEWAQLSEGVFFFRF